MKLIFNSEIHSDDLLTELNNVMYGDSEEKILDYELDGDQYRLVVKLINKSSNPNPEYAKHGDSGFDLRANLTEPMVLLPNTINMVPTGLYFQVPYNYEMQVRSRSGLAAKSGIMVLNSPGTVDSGYRGEVMAILYNTGAKGSFQVNHGDRICQAVICPVVHNVKLTQVNELDASDRGEGGIGHTKIQ